jgi:hypothetical protein
VGGEGVAVDVDLGAHLAGSLAFPRGATAAHARVQQAQRAIRLKGAAQDGEGALLAGKTDRYFRPVCDDGQVAHATGVRVEGGGNCWVPRHGLGQRRVGDRSAHPRIEHGGKLQLKLGHYVRNVTSMVGRAQRGAVRDAAISTTSRQAPGWQSAVRSGG